MEEKKSFVLFNDLGIPVESLPDDEAGKLFKAIFEYQNGGVKQELSAPAEMAFIFVKQQLDRSQEKYEKICEKNRINGAKGGRPKEPKKPTGLNDNPKNPNEPKKPDTDTDTDTENDKEEKNHKYGEFNNITLSDKEYQKCLSKYGEDTTKLAIEKLANWKKSKGKKTKSDYATMNSWVWKSLKEETKKVNTDKPFQVTKFNNPGIEDLVKRTYAKNG